MATERETQPKPERADRADGAGQDDALPTAGPHAAPELTDPGKTPGSGTLPSDEENAGDATEAPTG
ncbi:hypothetical protein CCR97_02690 [Rhodoplanes elegans]|uniref:Uncharacterized protein n=1 Tax=Rhodoplanes elegans TaxID=29408 RepID=A0A327KLQ8_9BRAD|nr:hypothetical protein [Rhodoplanes elegans]MBK5957121.1 hypothetical protein [Rhodoplanes elegans]RAI39719.1 hypothetical protein CH338_08510 [Rhodoplanes elegans]